ncbi:6-phosphogluconolactonase [Rhodocytophaga rosea]|uniref:6-phosphogluconolactonase n=1 Tax=Rhodocytophaga rosea TaxID=2704465 RepID=A0A6C0GGN7_9BACT|nr:6-phosphogluconolactonase [Rhodocytophaga rosea]QHT66850.1 6-phosphogluconolactonase [Rhodocytophaga rosea]
MFHIYSTSEQASQALASYFAEAAKEAVQTQGRFTVALTGGSSPKQLYQILANSPYRDSIPWNKTFVFWGDERSVPFNDSRNNAKMTFEALLNHVPVPKDQIYPMSGEIPADESARQYEGILQKHFAGQPPQFDLILLGLGENGHTASLFPYTPVLEEKERWVKEVYLTDQQMYRITLTAPFINQAKKIAFILFGSSKAQVLYDVVKGKYQPDFLPAQLIKPSSGKLHWFIDEAAAHLVK